MKWILLVPLAMLAVTGCNTSTAYEPRDGDLIFQTSLSAQSRAIQLATHSPYSHMGIVYVEDDRPMVFEAVGPVKSTPLAEWIARGDQGHYVVKRLKGASDVLTPEVLEKMKQIGQSKYQDRPYDRYFQWSDDRIYCSELVWKIYQEGAGVRIGELRRLGDFDLSSPQVQDQLREKFGNAIPADELVISPAAMLESNLLKTEFEN